MVAELLSLMHEIVRIHGDAVPADQSGRVSMEVPFGAGSLKHICCGNPHLPEYQGEFVCESDVQIPLDVLDDLCRLRGSDVSCFVYGCDPD